MCLLRNLSLVGVEATLPVTEQSRTLRQVCDLEGQDRSDVAGSLRRGLAELCVEAPQSRRHALSLPSIRPLPAGHQLRGLTCLRVGSTPFPDSLIGISPNKLLVIGFCSSENPDGHVLNQYMQAPPAHLFCDLVSSLSHSLVPRVWPCRCWPLLLAVACFREQWRRRDGEGLANWENITQLRLSR